LSGRLGAKKSVERLIADSELPQFRLSKSLGPWSMCAIGLGAIVGSGIYFLPGIAARGFPGSRPPGPSLVLSYLVPALVCLLLGLCYAELASIMPLAGSVYTWSYAAMGELAAWMTGWIMILEYAVANVAIASFAGYLLKSRLADFGIPVPEHWSMPPLAAGRWTGMYFNLPAFFALVIVTVISSWGVRLLSRINVVMVALKLGGILFFLAVGGALVRPANWRPFAPGGTRAIVFAGAALFFSFIGFDCVSVAAEESKTPARDVATGILGSIGVSAVLYMAVTAVVTGMVPYTAFVSYKGPDGAVLSALKVAGAGGAAQAVVNAGMLIGMLSLMLVIQYSQSRVWFAMARDGLLPGVFSWLHPKTRVPHWCVWIGGLALAVPAGLIDGGEIGDLASIGALAAFVMVVVCLIVLRRTGPDLARRFRVPWSPWLPLAALVGVIGLMLALAPAIWLRFGIWMAVGLAVYFSYGFRRSSTA